MTGLQNNAIMTILVTKVMIVHDDAGDGESGSDEGTGSECLCRDSEVS